MSEITIQVSVDIYTKHAKVSKKNVNGKRNIMMLQELWRQRKSLFKEMPCLGNVKEIF